MLGPVFFYKVHSPRAPITELAAGKCANCFFGKALFFIAKLINFPKTIEIYKVFTLPLHEINRPLL